jgi:uncharacterized protein involved in exopolysaccharide biosynthesis
MAKLRNWAPRWNAAILGNGADMRAAEARRRRIVSFAAMFGLAATVSLTYLFTRAPEYRSVARLQIDPGSIAPATDSGADASDSHVKAFLTEIQVLTSRPLLETAVAKLKDSGELPGDLGPDPVDSVQRMLSTEIVDGTDVVQLDADGARRAFLPRLVDTIVAAYQARLEETYKALAANADAGVGEELRLLDEKVAAKRAEVDAFRARYDIVSLERDENQVLSRVRGLATALNEANDRVATAEGHLQALRETTAGPAHARDNATVADMERRASEMRGSLQEYGRKFTPQYMDMDPDVRAMRARLADLEQQIQIERASSQKTAILEAQQELASARAAVERLKQQSDEAGSAARTFTDRFGEYKALQEDLTQLEELHRGALGRQAKLEARERETEPRMTVLESAALPQKPWRPAYVLDAGLSLAGSLILGFFAVWFVEFFAPRPPQEPTMILREGWGALPFPQEAQPAAPTMLAVNAPLHLLAQEASLEAGRRALSDAEIVAILGAANDDAKLAILALMAGIGPQELSLLDWDAVDLDGGLLNVKGQDARALPIEGPLRRLLADRRAANPAAAGTLLRDPSGAALSAADLDNLVTYAAYDAALDRADEVTPEVLRHTYILYLLRQGIRLADIGRIVGRIPRDELVAYTRLGLPEMRLPLDRIERVPPALRDLDRSDRLPPDPTS